MPAISGDGRFVAFVSQSSNLDPADPAPLADVFVRDMLLNTTTVVSRATGAAGAPADGVGPAISWDGRYVTFSSFANLDPDDADDNSEASPGPQAAKTVVARIDGGRVLVRTPASPRFVRLRGAELVPVGSVVDARQGGVILTSARSSSTVKRTQSIRLTGAIF